MGDQQSSMDAHPIYQVSQSVNNFVNNFVNRRYHVNNFREPSICPNLNSLQKQLGSVLDQNLWTKPGMNQ